MKIIKVSRINTKQLDLLTSKGFLVMIVNEAKPKLRLIK